MTSQEVLLNQLAQNPAQIQFEDVMSVIEYNYLYELAAFKNGLAYNAVDQNQGSAKLFAFAQLNKLTKEQTLALFGQHYRAVLATPQADDHQNIRQFMANGWEGIEFENFPIICKEFK